jgi:hypothetical protein
VQDQCFPPLAIPVTGHLFYPNPNPGFISLWPTDLAGISEGTV